MSTPSPKNLSLTLLVTALAVFPTLSTTAQSDEQLVESIRSVLKAERKATVAEAMQFTPEEAGAFWPRYQKYRAEMDKIGDELKALLLEYARLYPEIPDERAKPMLKQILELEEEQIEERAEFLKSLGKLLSPAKTLRLAQVENRFDLAVRLELASTIPLVPIEGKIRGAASAAAVYAEGRAGGAVVGTYELTANVIAVDKANRKVTLLSQDSIKQTVKLGPEVINFDQIQVGDQLRITATEELVVGVADPDSAAAGGATVVALSPKGAKPGAWLADTRQVTGTITGLDQDLRTVTLRFQDGSTRTLPVRRDVDLAKRKVGDQVSFRLTETIAIKVSKP